MGYIAYMKREFSTIRLIDPWFLYILILTSAISSFSLLGLVADERVVYRVAAKLLSNSLQVLKIGKELENKINWKLLFLSVSKIISTLLFCTS